MPIDLIEYIQHLLHRNNVAILPGFGALVATATPSVFDHARGIMHPPSKVISFNENLKVNDGLLMNHVRNKHGISHQDARSIVENFVSSVMSILREGEPVLLDKIGKFYLNSNNVIVFEPTEKSNFNVATYGLPALKYYPVPQHKRHSILEEKPTENVEVIEKANTQVTDNQTINKSITDETPLPTPSTSSYSWLPRRNASMMAAGIIGASILTGMLIFNQQQKNKGNGDSSNAITVSDTRLNVRPTHENETTSIENQTIPTEKSEEKITENSIVKTEENNTTITQKTETTPIIEEQESTPKNDIIDAVDEDADKSYNIVFIGSFSSERNAQRAAKRIKRKGLEVYREKINGMRRVGTPIFFSDENEKNKALNKVRRLFGKQCWERK